MANLSVSLTLITLLIFFLKPLTCAAKDDQLKNTPKDNITVVLREPPLSNHGQYVKHVLTKAYTLIGANIEWFETSGSRELALVASGKLTGGLARAPIIEHDFPTLIRIPHPILSFKLFKVSDRLRCGYCLDKDIHSISYAKGSIISERYVKSLPVGIESFALNAPEQLSAMIKKRRVDSVLLMDFQLTEGITGNPLYIIDEIDEELDYHYLSPHYSHLKAPLIKAFNTLVASGELIRLQHEHNIFKPSSNTTPYEKTKLNFVANNWDDYTNKDGTGIYWRLIDSIFKLPFTNKKYVLKQEQVVDSFNRGDMDILVGAYQSLPLKNATFSHYHIDFEYPLLVFAKSPVAINKFNAKSADLRICIQKNVGAFLQAQIEFISPNNIINEEVANCGPLLIKGQVDAIITYQYHLPSTFSQFIQQTVIERTPLFLAFQNNDRGLALKKLFDKRIKRMAENEQLKSVFPNRETYIQAHISRLK